LQYDGGVLQQQQPADASIGFPVLPCAVGSDEAEMSKRMRVEGNNGAIYAVASGPTNSFVSALSSAAAHAMLQQPARGRKKKSQDQVDRRRERNRVLAKRTRLRKKFFFESLQKEILDLQRDNLNLKAIVKENLDEGVARQILDGCNALERMPPSVLEACSEGFEDMDSQDFNLVQSIQKSQHAFIITDPSLEDNPIVFASDDFLKLTGYDRSEVLGRNCRFLQGEQTSKAKLAMIRDGLSKGEDVSVTFINYMKDGTPFWNKLFIAALRDAQENIVNYIGVTVVVASPPPGDPEHGVRLPEEQYSSDGEHGC
jgi:PAS domain S-box-containing protein